MTTRVLLADDHVVVRSGLALILDSAEGIEVVGEAEDGGSAVRQARKLRPDVTLMDVRMPGMDGVEATRQIVAENLCEVVVLTTFDLDEYIYGALQAGAVGFLLKSADATQLIDAVRMVASGGGVIEPMLTRRLLTKFTTPQPKQVAHHPGIDQLTDRERDVLVQLGAGLSNHDIARRLYIGETTVKTYVSRLLAKLGLHSRVQAAILAQEIGLVADSPGTA
ncbi:response regulator transcription factor [Amycolatopsis sp. NPDC051071]|uniref:response regulator transcription factor n=1 Tax=Amycolatopsis sp. NPDC051071 TaxID=3154637 RepID=UPI003412D25C